MRSVILPFLWPRAAPDCAPVWSSRFFSDRRQDHHRPGAVLLQGRGRSPERARARRSLPLAALLAYGLARLCASGFSELRDAIFAKVAETAGRLVSLRVFSHLFSLSLRYLERRTGELARVIERGVAAITFLLGIVLFNIGPTLFEFALVIGILLVKYSWPFAFVAFATIVAYAIFTFLASGASASGAR